MKATTPDEHKLQYQRLQKLTHGNRMKLIDCELKLALTMTELAQTEADRGDKPHAKVLLEKVEQAMDAVRRYMTGDLISDDEHRKIKDSLQDLVKRQLAAKQRILGAPARAHRKNASV